MQLLFPTLKLCSSFSLLMNLYFLLMKNNIQIYALTQLPVDVRYKAIFSFGDSIVDPGNNNYLRTWAKCNFPPYGRDFMGAKSTGRFSNGKLPTDLIAEELGVKEHIPPYLDPTLKPEDLLTGVSFASGGSGYDPLTAKILGVSDMSDQLNLFKEYISKLNETAGEDKAHRIISDGGYVVAAGSNDIASTYILRKYKYDIQAYIDFLLEEAASFLEGLYEAGARRIAVFSVPPVGCLPAQRTLQWSKQSKCVDTLNEAAIQFNSKLSSVLDELNGRNPDAKIIYIDVYNPLLDMMTNPHHYGFEVVHKGCCGTGKLEVGIFCKSWNPFTCKNVSTFMFWDSMHPTQKTYEALVYPLLKKYLKFFF